MSNNINNIKNWIIKANNDLKIAGHEIENDDPVLDMICFHCQQAVEKYFKAFLIYNDKEIERTHNLYFLQKKCGEIDASIEKIDLKELNFFGISVRYPDDFYLPTIEETKEYLNIANEIKSLIKSIIPGL